MYNNGKMQENGVEIKNSTLENEYLGSDFKII